MRFEACAHRGGLLAFTHRQIRFHIRWRWCGRRAQQAIQHPRTTQHRRSAITVRRAQQHRALAQQAPTVFVGERYAAELRAEHAFDVVVTCQRFIDEGVVGIQQIHHAAVFQQYAGEEQLHLGFEVAAHGGVEGAVSRFHLIKFVEVQPRDGKVLHQGLRA